MPTSTSKASLRALPRGRSALEDEVIFLHRGCTLPGEWKDDDFDVLADGAVVGRIFKVHVPRQSLFSSMGTN